MARVEQTDTWKVEGEIAVIGQAVRYYCRQCGMSAASDQVQALELLQGSQFLTRLIGGWLVPARWLPMRAVIQFSQVEGKAVQIRALIEEALGFGFLDPILADKYRNHFERWMNGLRMVTAR